MLGNATVVDGRVARRLQEAADANAAFVVGVALKMSRPPTAYPPREGESDD